MKVAALIFLFVLVAASGYAQTVKGTVKDTAGRAVPYATVSLKNSATNTIIAYTAADGKGNFALQVPANNAANTFTIEVHSLGYKTMAKNISAFNAPVDFTLTEEPKQLQEVVVKNGRPVLRTNGDTLTYRVGDFSNPQDRTIGDVIKRLPGITVDADGTIRYNNQPITTVYVGGDNLLDDKYSIATNSIPQGAVNQVQVLQNNQPIKALQNKVVSNDVALNLTFKKGAKLHVMGQESVGAGVPGNYDVNLNAMMFKDKYKAINYLAGNNTGNDVQQDLVSHNLTENNQRIDNALPATVLSLGAVNTPQLAENRYLFDKAGVLNLNNLVNFKNDVQLKLNAYYVHDQQRQDYSQQTTVFLPGDTVKYNEAQHNRIVPNVLHAQFTLNINRPKYYLNDALLLDEKKTNSYSDLKADSQTVNQVFKDNMLSFSNELNLIQTLKSGRIIQLYSYVSHSGEPENLAIGGGYNAAIFNNNMSYAQLVQHVDVPSWYTNNYLSFKIPLSLITQSFRTGFSVQQQTLNSNLDVVQNNGSINLEQDSALNHVNWTKEKFYAEASYDLPGKILKANLTLPLTLQHTNYNDTLYTQNKSLTRVYFNPQFNAKYQVGAENYVNVLYSYRNEIGTIENVYPGYILTNYRTLYANNGDITQQQIQQAGGGFSYRKALTLFFWNVNALYAHTEANNITSSIITNNIQKGVVLPYANGTDSWMLSGNISKYLFALHTTISAAVQWQSSHSVQIQNNALLPFNTTTETFNINVDTKVSDKINFSNKATLTQISSHSPVEASAYKVDQLLQQATIYYDPVDAVQLKLSGEHYFTYQQGNPNLKYFFADASAKFKVKKWRTDFELSAVNFLNVKTYNALYLSANTLTASSYTLPGRIVLLKVLFNL